MNAERGTPAIDAALAEGRTLAVNVLYPGLERLTQGERHAYQLWMMPFTRRPDAVNSASLQSPKGFAPRTRADALPSP